MQTLIIGKSRYTLAPTRNIGELQAQFAKFTGKAKHSRITAHGVKYPRFHSMMSTADYVKAFEQLNGHDTTRKPGFWAPLNTAECTLYTGDDLHQTLPDGFADWEAFDKAQCADPAPMPAPEAAPVAPIECAAPVTPEPASEAPSAAVAVSESDARAARDIVEAFYDDFHGAVPVETMEARARHLRGSAAGFATLTDPARVAQGTPYAEAARILEADATAKRNPLPAINPELGTWWQDDGKREAAPLDVGAALRRGLERTPFGNLPLYARVAIERLDADSSMRNSATMGSMLDAYARTYGSECDDATRASAHYISGRRFWDFSAAPDDAHGAAGCAKREEIEPAAPVDAEPAPRAYAFPDAAPCPLATHSYRYALVNRPAMLGTIPGGLRFEIDPRPATGAPHHEMARHGILCTTRELTAAECIAFELAPLADGAALETLADVIAADLGEYASAYLDEHAEDPESFMRAVLQRADRPADGMPRQSIGDPEALVSSVLAKLRAMVPPIDPPPTHRAQAEDGPEWFARIVRENKAVRDKAQEMAQACAPLDSIHFVHPDGERYGIAGPDMSEPGRFRFSYFDSHGAIGHCTRDTLALAVWEGIDLGYRYATENGDPVPPATQPDTQPVPADTIAAVGNMSAADAFDYLADYTDNEPRDDAARQPDAMRAAVLADVSRTGAAVFLGRMRPDAPMDTGAELEFVSRWTGAKCEGLSELSATIECARRKKAEPAGFVFKVAPCAGEGLASWQVSAMRGKFEVQRWRAVAPIEPAAIDVPTEHANAQPNPRPADPPASDPVLSEAPADDFPAWDETIPAPLDGLDVAELGADGLAEFEKAQSEPIPNATAPAYVEIFAARSGPPAPPVLIPAYDLRARIPQRFAPVYLLQA